VFTFNTKLFEGTGCIFCQVRLVLAAVIFVAMINGFVAGIIFQFGCMQQVCFMFVMMNKGVQQFNRNRLETIHQKQAENKACLPWHTL
jgi:hypothetical protein